MYTKRRAMSTSLFLILAATGSTIRAAVEALIHLDQSLTLLSTIKSSYITPNPSSQLFDKDSLIRQLNTVTQSLKQLNVRNKLLYASVVPQNRNDLIQDALRLIGITLSSKGWTPDTAITEFQKAENNAFADFDPDIQNLWQDFVSALETKWQEFENTKKDIRVKLRGGLNKAIEYLDDLVIETEAKKFMSSKNSVAETALEPLKDPMHEVLGWYKFNILNNFQTAQKNNFKDFVPFGVDIVNLCKKFFTTLDTQWSAIEKEKNPEPEPKPIPSSEVEQKTKFIIPEKLFTLSTNSAGISPSNLKLYEKMKTLYNFASNELLTIFASVKKIPHEYTSFIPDEYDFDKAFSSNIKKFWLKAQKNSTTNPKEVMNSIDKIVTMLFYEEYLYPGMWGRVALLATQASEEDKKFWAQESVQGFIARFVTEATSLGWKPAFKIPKGAMVIRDYTITLTPQRFAQDMQKFYESSVRLLIKHFELVPSYQYINVDRQELTKPDLENTATIGQYFIKMHYASNYINSLTEKIILQLFYLEDRTAGTWEKGIIIDNEELAKALPDYQDRWQSFMKELIAAAKAGHFIE